MMSLKFLERKLMKNNLFHSFIYLGLFLLGFIAGKWWFSDDDHIPIHSISDPIVIRDTIIGDIPKPDTMYVQVPVDIDTAAIIESYFTKLNYNDTIIDYPELKVSLSDVIYQNSLYDRKVYIDYTRPVPNRLNALSVGADFSCNSLPVYMSFRKNRVTYKLGYDFFSKALVGGLSYDLWQW